MVNVIECPNERNQTLQAAWKLAKSALVVSARLNHEEKTLAKRDAHQDGVVTSTSTFQKFFEQGELREWIETSLETTAEPAAPGIFFVFRDEGMRERFLARRFRRRIANPRTSRSQEQYEDNQELLEPLRQFVLDHGRLPVLEELDSTPAICEAFGSIKRAFRVIQNSSAAGAWDEVREQRAEDLLLYVALSRFGKRPRFGNLDRTMQQDVKSFFGSYKAACEKADELLFALGDLDVIYEACKKATVGKLTPEALYVHADYVDRLPLTLRLYEGCARNYVGSVESGNILKLNRLKPKISYLSYPDFEKKAHPELVGGLVVSLGSRNVRYFDYEDRENPPILHRKETFVAEDHPAYAKFAKLTRSEERQGLLSKNTIGTRVGWEELLQAEGLSLKGHRLFGL